MACCGMTGMPEKPTKDRGQRATVDSRLAEAVRIIVEDFGGDFAAFLESIRPKANAREKPEGHERRLVEAL